MEGHQRKGGLKGCAYGAYLGLDFRMTAGSAALLPDSFIPSPAVLYLVFFQAQPCVTQQNPHQCHPAQLSRVRCGGASHDEKCTGQMHRKSWSSVFWCLLIEWKQTKKKKKGGGKGYNVPYRLAWMPSFGSTHPDTDASCQQKPI